MARATREHSEATERSLLGTAGTLFAEQGYSAVSLEQIANAAGVTRGAIYHHFGSKIGLFSAVVSQAQERVAVRIARAAPGHGWRAIEAGCLEFMRASVDPSVRRTLLVDAPAVLGWAQWRQIDSENAVELLADGLARLDDLAIDAHAAGALLNGAMNEAALWIAEGGDQKSAEHGVLLMIRALRRGGSSTDDVAASTSRDATGAAHQR